MVPAYLDFASTHSEALVAEVIRLLVELHTRGLVGGELYQEVLLLGACKWDLSAFLRLGDIIDVAAYSDNRSFVSRPARNWKPAPRTHPN